MASSFIKGFLSTLKGGKAQEVTVSELGNNRIGLDVAGSGVISQGNSTTSPLISGETFTGAGEQNNFPHVGVMVKADQAGIMYFDFSNDGVNWDSTFPVAGFNTSANIPEFHTAVKLGRYFRIRFKNTSSSNQTYIRLTTYYGDGFLPSNAAINQSIGLDSDAIAVRPTNFGDEVILGRRSGIRNFTKFGHRTNLTAAAGEETLWNTAGNFVPMTTASTFTIAFNNTTDGLGTTGALSLFFDYIDANGLYQNTIVTLDGSGSQVTAFTGLGINRIAVVESGSANTNVNTITITETTGGTTQATVTAGDSVTHQCIFFTDANSDAVARFLWINANKLSGGSTPTVVVKAYVFNRTYETTYEVFRCTIDTGVDNFVTLSEPNGFKLEATDVLYFVADTDTNGTTVNLRFSLMEYKRT